MKIEHIQCFLEAVHCQSISAAAKKLYMSQSSLSSVIQSLESELGYPLIRRSAKGIVLTENGVQAMEIFQQMNSDYCKLKEYGTDSESKLKHIHICVYPCISAYLSTAMASRLKDDRYNGALVSIFSASETRILARVRDGAANIAVGMCKDSELDKWRAESGSSGYVLEELCKDTPYCLVHPQSKLASRKSVHIYDLKDEHLATAPSCMEIHGLDQYVSFTKQIAMFTNTEAAIQTVASSQFITIVPGLAISHDKRVLDGEIIALPFLGTDEVFINFLIHLSEDNLSKLEKMVREDIRELMK